jgi:hypothetical protein
MRKESLEYQKKVLNPWIFRIGMLLKLPSVYFWGIIIKSLDENQCKLTLPYNWRTQNPFSSIYFAALAGAAELSTGALCQLHLAGRGPHSMLVINFQMEYLKKAASLITLSCDQGLELASCLDDLKAQGETSTFQMVSTARDISGEIVAKAYITWSFKRK